MSDFWGLILHLWLSLPWNDTFLFWITRQWQLEGVVLLSCLAAVCSVLSNFRRRRKFRISWLGAWWLLVLWAASGLLYTIDRGVSLRALLSLAAYGLLAYAVCSLIRSPKDVLIWSRFLVIAAVVVSLEGLLQYTQTFETTLGMMDGLRETEALASGGWGLGVVEDFLIRKRIFSVFGWPNLFAGFLLLVIPIGVGLCVGSRSFCSRIGWGMAVLVLGTCLLLTLSLGAWLAAVFTLVIIWLLRLRKDFGRMSIRAEKDSVYADRKPAGLRVPMRLLAVGIAVCIAFGVGGFIVVKRAHHMIRASAGSRIAYAQGASSILKIHPLVGTGLGTFGTAYQALRSLERVEGQHDAIHAHNTLLEFAAELGLIGLLFLLFFLWKVGQLITAAWRGGSEATGGVLARWLAIGVLAFFMHGLLEQVFVEAATAPFWWIALGLLTGALVTERVPSVPRKSFVDRFMSLALPLVVACIGIILVCRMIAADFWAGKGALADLSGNPQEMTQNFAQAKKWDPLISRYSLEHGERLMRQAGNIPAEKVQTQIENADLEFQRAVKLSPWLSFGWRRLGVTSWHLGLVDEAILATKEAVRRDPNSRATIKQLARILGGAGRFEELLQAAQALQQMEPADPFGLFLEAQAWQLMESPQRAKQVYRALLARFPDHYASLFNMAGLLKLEGDSQGASAMYETFLRKAPEDQQKLRAAARSALAELKNK